MCDVVMSDASATSPLLLPHRHFGVAANHSGPLTDPPIRDQPVCDVWIGARKRLGRRRGIAAEEEHGAIRWIGERACKDELAASHGRARVRKVRRTQRRTT